jgi:hypothetical protein
MLPHPVCCDAVTLVGRSLSTSLTHTEGGLTKFLDETEDRALAVYHVKPGLFGRGKDLPVEVSHFGNYQSERSVDWKETHRLGSRDKVEE